MRSNKEGSAAKIFDIVVCHRAQSQRLKALHLNTIMHDIAQRIDLAKALQRNLRLADGTHHAEAETRIIVDYNAHIR
jgi:hypothetical protein